MEALLAMGQTLPMVAMVPPAVIVAEPIMLAEAEVLVVTGAMVEALEVGLVGLF